MSSSNTGRAEPIPKREFDNPIYGGNETDSNVYTVPSYHQNLPEMESEPDHEFGNVIYGTEIVENTYSMLSSPATYDTVADVGQKEYEPINGVNGQTPVSASEQVYDDMDY